MNSYRNSSCGLYQNEIDRLEMLDPVLKHLTADVTVCDRAIKTPVDICTHLYMEKKRQMPVLIFLHLIEKLCLHATVNKGLIVAAMSALALLDISVEDIPPYKRSKTFLDEPCADYFKTSIIDKYTSLIASLNESPLFNVNDKGGQGQTIAHFTSKSKNFHMTDILVNREEFDPNIQDKDGNTALFYIVKYFTKCEDIGRILKLLKPKLDLELKNAADQSLLDICNNVEDRGTREALKRILHGDFGLTTGNDKILCPL